MTMRQETNREAESFLIVVECIGCGTLITVEELPEEAFCSDCLIDDGDSHDYDFWMIEAALSDRMETGYYLN